MPVLSFYQETEPTYGPCGRAHLRERMLRAVALLGREEVEDIVEEQGHVEVTCEFCRECIQFGTSSMRAIKASKLLSE